MNNKKHIKNGPPGMNVPDKANNFTSAMKRLFNELKSFRILIFFAFIVAILSAILSIITPSRLSDLTDNIQSGLVINTTNMKTITEKIKSGINDNIVIDEKTITVEEQIEFAKILSTLNENSTANDLYKKIDEMPTPIQELIKPNMNINKRELLLK